MSAVKEHKQPWIHSASVDVLGITGLPFFVLLCVLAFPVFFEKHEFVSPAMWLILVMGIDVSHVYSTLFRTYLDTQTFKMHRQFMILLPVIVWVAGIVLYSFGSLAFWRVIAYLAVFHFIRQQYGFLKIYMRNEKKSTTTSYEIYLIYIITGIPILIWHLSPDRVFVWFVKNDFISVHFSFLIPYLTGLLFACMAVYSVLELIISIRMCSINIPKNLLITGTFVSWYFGIVYFNSDLIFTLFNVITHGIPYIVLIWIYGNKKASVKTTPAWYSFLFTWKGVLFYLSVLVAFSFMEEGLWDSMVWEEHTGYFQMFRIFPSVAGKTIMTLIVPLLAVPQITHYVIDGYIWKIKKDSYQWKNDVLGT
ncbi:MAG: hypothetical protein H7259_10535 [Cytophagales bacterium]|nr:hypothetical protein [Cytophaga sp.]